MKIGLELAGRSCVRRHADHFVDGGGGSEEIGPVAPVDPVGPGDPVGPVGPVSPGAVAVA